MLEDIWDSIVDGFEYIISFSWISDFWEGLIEVFSSIGEFSTWGLIGGILSAGLIFMLRDYMIQPFLVNMSVVGYWFTAGLTYLVCFAAGYLIFKHFSDTA